MLAAVLVTVASACSEGASQSAATPSPVAGSCITTYANGTRPVIADARRMAGTRMLCFRAFAVLHSGVTRTPLWVTERLTRVSVEAARALDTRDNRFHAEERLPTGERAELEDYRGSGFDRGHMAPSGDMGRPVDDYESFSLANMVPQDGSLNRGGWADLEGYVRDLAATLGEAYVVTGPAFSGATLRRLDGRVLVPSHVWKAVRVPGQGAGAWIAVNGPGSRWEVVSIATLAARVGVDPFPGLDHATRSRVPAFPTFGPTQNDGGDGE